MAGDLDKRQSTTGYVFTFAGAVISWVYRLQKVVALSTMEVGYIVITQGAKENCNDYCLNWATYNKNLCCTVTTTKQYIWQKNVAFHNRTKHIEL